MICSGVWYGGLMGWQWRSGIRRAMTPANSSDQEVRVDEVFMECAEKEGFPGFGFFRKGANCALWGQKRLPEEKLQVAKPKDDGLPYTDRYSGSKKWKSRFRMVEQCSEDLA
jgi:hypothetical protein